MRKEEIRADDPMVRSRMVSCMWNADPSRRSHAIHPSSHPLHCAALHPQAAYMLKKQRQAQAASGGKLKPEYKGPASKPNRFNIK